MNCIDLRSDTVTRPSEGMRKAMYQAEVGDDVYCEDPTVRRLEETMAGLSGHESALFASSGTMGNLVSLLTHCGRGDAAILGAESHILFFEGGGLAAVGGILPLVPLDRAELKRTVNGKDQITKLNIDQILRGLGGDPKLQPGDRITIVPKKRRK